MRTKTILSIFGCGLLFILMGYTYSVTRLEKEEDRFQKDRQIFEETHRASFDYFWELGHPVSGLTPRRSLKNKKYEIGIGASGFGIQAIIVGAHRGWVTREQVLNRMLKMTDFLENKAVRFHGVYPHLIHGKTGQLIHFGGQDGADIQETSNLMMGLLMARAYFDQDTPKEIQLREEITKLWEAVDYTMHEHQNALWWNHSYQQKENKGLKLLMKGYTESMTSYVLALGHPSKGIKKSSYRGYVEGKNFVNGKEYYGYTLDVGKPKGGPLYLAQTPFLALDPRDMEDQYTYYWKRSINHSLINWTYCSKFAPKEFQYNKEDWGLTASQTPSEDGGYNNMAGPGPKDKGVIAPSAALGVFPYVPYQSMLALRNFYENHKEGLWGEYGFKDAYSKKRDWYSDRYLGLDQGRTVIMMENYRSGLFWELSKKVPELQVALGKMGIKSPKHKNGFPLAVIEKSSKSVQLYRHPDLEKYHLDFYTDKDANISFYLKSTKAEKKMEIQSEQKFEAGLHQLQFEKDNILAGTKGILVMKMGKKEIELPVQLF
ncbi:glucoamylase family protein [Flammeovirga sp. SJP92]|uniref:glucoamylase family protein n=1 Tax=Flammeovirga sp. SJP92 TaxID=1775430 RepID=UPI0009EE4435|nr:glucoamylase family protein [Flammeovirga sp. SJP92]